MRGTVLDICKQAAVELGLPLPTELVTSQEQTSMQLLGLFNACGNELLAYYDWQFILKQGTITTVAGQGRYPTPSDYASMYDQTMWDKTNRRPAHGPVSSQGWQVLTNALVQVGPFARYRVQGDNFEFLPVPQEAGREFNYQYTTNGWIQSYLDPNAYNSMVQNDLDTPLFDYWLLTKFLKLKFCQVKGLDTSAVNNDFTRVFDAATGQDHGAPVLSLSRTFQAPWLSAQNLPDGNWNGTP